MSPRLSHFPNTLRNITVANAYTSPVDKDSGLPLLEAMFFSTLHLYLPIVIPRLLRIGLNVAVGFLLRDVIVAISLQHVPSEVQNKLITASGMIYFGIAVCGRFSLW